jgi:TolB-like protein
VAYIFLTGGLFFALLPMLERRRSEATQGIGSLLYLFEDYALDTDRRELYRGADVLPVAPQVFDLLQYLVRHRERVVSKDDLITAIWNGRVVSDAALTTRLNVARGAIGDTGDVQRLIKTLPRKGFRFVGTVHEDEGPTIAKVHVRAELPLTSTPRLSIVVLPFANLSGDPEQDYFVDGVTESLTTDLSRISGSFVIGRHTAFTYKGEARDLKKIGRELNVRYLLEGSVQRSDKRFRVNVQLVDAETANHIWAERFDKPMADLFDMQDEVVSRLANALNAELIAAEARRAERSPHPDSLDFYFQGIAWFNKGPTPDHMAQARAMFERALALDLNNIEAMTWTAAVNLEVASAYMSDDGGALVAAAEAMLAKVLSLAPNHAFAHLLLGSALNATNRAAQCISECERALALDRNLADAHAEIGLARHLMGQGAETEAHVNEALRISPRDIYAHRWLAIVGISKLQILADAEALGWFRRSIELNRNYPLAHFWLATALALLGSPGQASAAAKAGLSLDPTFTVRRFRDGAPSDNPTFLARRKRVCEGMRLAGIPEG